MILGYVHQMKNLFFWYLNSVFNKIQVDFAVYRINLTNSVQYLNQNDWIKSNGQDDFTTHIKKRSKALFN